MFVVRFNRNLKRCDTDPWITVCIAGLLLGCPPFSLAQQLSPSSGFASTTLSGRVVNAVTGLPVPRALVRFSDRALLADHDGRFEFDQLTDASGNLQVTKPGFAMTIDPSDSPNMFIQLDEAHSPLELRLYPEALLTGTISAPNGEPLAHINVQARRSSYDESGHHWFPVASAQTDTHGQFRLPVPAGDYKLQTNYVPHNQDLAEAVLPVSLPTEDSQNISPSIHLHSGEEQHFDLHPNLRRTFSVTLAVDSDLDRAYPIITARTTQGSTFSLRPTPTPLPGQLRVDLPSGSYMLTARIGTADEIQIAETNVTVADHDLAGVVLRFARTPTIPVELEIDAAATSDNATPPVLAQFGISLQSSYPDSEIGFERAQLVTHRDAPSTLNVQPGTYRLQARNSNEWYIESAGYGASDLLRQNLVVTPGSGGIPIRLLVSNQTGSLQGTVRLNGKPASAWVYLISTTPSVSAVTTLRSNADGTLMQPHLPPGNYQAIAFERRHSVDFADPATIAPFAAQVQSVSITAGNKLMLNLNAVPQSELQP